MATKKKRGRPPIHGVDTAQLAKLAGVSRRRVYSYFDPEERKRIRPPTLRAIEHALKRARRAE
jgi:AcrR family transcriptional regulator